MVARATRPGEPLSGGGGISGFIGTVFGSVIGTVVGGLIAVIIVLPLIPMIYFYKRYVKRKEQKEANAVALTQVQAAAIQGPSGVQQAPVVLKPSVGHPTDDATRRRVDLAKAQVDIWFYPKMGIARRTMRITDARLRKKLGNRLSLPEMSIEGMDQAAVELITREDVENILKGNEPKPREVKVKPLVEKEAKAAPQETVCVAEPESAVESNGVVENSIVKREKASPRNKAVTYRGKLVKFGLETFEGKGKGKGKEEEPYQCYAVSLDDFKLGTVHVIKGVDLERAIKDSGVNIGEDIEAHLVGEMEVLVKGKVHMKKIWHIAKINSVK